MDKIFLFLILLLSGADRLSFHILGLHIRIVQIIALMAFLLFFIYRKFIINRENLFLFTLFYISSLLSFIYFINLKSFVFEIYFLFDYIFIYWLIINFTKYLSYIKTLNIYLISMEIIALYTIFQFILGQIGISDPFFASHYPWGIKRPAVWYYEPSYLAITLIIYFAISFYLFLNLKYANKLFKIKKHLLISLLSVIATTSSTAYIGLIITILFGYFFSKKVKIVNLILIGLFLAVFFYILDFLSGGFVSHQLTRLDVSSLNQLNGVSGGRIEGWFFLLKSIKQHFLFGIGGGNYFVIHHIVATNVTLELIAELGIIGFILFIFFLNYPIIYYFLNKTRYNKLEQIYINSLLFSLFIALIVWQANQNYMRIYMWIHYALIYSFIFYLSYKKRINENIH